MKNKKAEKEGEHYFYEGSLLSSYSRYMRSATASNAKMQGNE